MYLLTVLDYNGAAEAAFVVTALDLEQLQQFLVTAKSANLQNALHQC